MYVEEGKSVREIVGATRGASRARTSRVVANVVRMVERSEFKRRQAPPGVKIQPKSFGKDRRNPITHAFEPWKER
jgi:NAD+ synthase (glutamine-hydrolysing)